MARKSQRRGRRSADYPIATIAPYGPDNFTLEPIHVPSPTMSASETLTALSQDASVQPVEALDSAESHRETLVEPGAAAVLVGTPIQDQRFDRGQVARGKAVRDWRRHRHRGWRADRRERPGTSRRLGGNSS
jgi:hypothetical protein